MADGLPMAQIPNFQLPGPSPIQAQPGLMQGIAGGIPQGAQIAAQQQALAIQRQQMEIEKNMKMLEIGSDMMISGGPEVQNTGQSLIQKAYPFLTGQPLPQGMPLDKDVAKDLGYFMDQHRTWQETGGKEGLSAQDAVSGAVQAMSRYGVKYQQQQMALLKETPMYNEAGASQEPGQIVSPGQTSGQAANFNPKSGLAISPQGQPVQGNFVPNTTIAREQNTRQMGAAGANAPFISSLKDYHTAVAGLERGDQIGDRTAILAAGKFLGETPEQMKVLAKSGFFGKNIASGITKILGSGDMTPEQRSDFRAVLDTHKQGLEKAAQIQTSMYPGASGPNLSTAAQPITKTLKSGKHVISSDGGKTWFYSK